MTAHIGYQRTVTGSNTTGLTLRNLEEMVKQAYAVGMSEDAKVMTSGLTGGMRQLDYLEVEER